MPFTMSSKCFFFLYLPSSLYTYTPPCALLARPTHQKKIILPSPPSLILLSPKTTRRVPAPNIFFFAFTFRLLPPSNQNLPFYKINENNPGQRHLSLCPHSQHQHISQSFICPQTLFFTCLVNVSFSRETFLFHQSPRVAWFSKTGRRHRLPCWMVG